MFNFDQINLESRLRLAKKRGFRCCLVLHQHDISALSAYLHDNVKQLTPRLIPNNQNNSDVSDQINALLGTDQTCIVFDASNTFHPNLLAAAAGTLVRGGVFALLPPPSDSRFCTRFNRILHSHRSALIGSDDDPTAYARLNAHNTNTAWQDEQDQLVQQLLTQLRIDNSITVIQADRGRGKSALIGRALAELNTAVTLTAPQRSACKVLLRHAGSSPITYVPVDQALGSTHSLLIVEEAGSIPIPVLQKLMQTSERIVFATTVQGYEGAGRGFALRFKRVLNKQKPDWQQLSPTQAIRWSASDPLEQFVNDALLLKSELEDINVNNVDASQTTIRLLDKDALASNEAQLSAVYGLLVQAHYQTTPNDLRNILDAPQLYVFAQYCGTTLTGAALVAIEGSIPDDLHTPIVDNTRRLPDQLIPQLLAQAADETAVLGKPFARVVRIAIHPNIQRQGFGTAFLNQLRASPALALHTLAASFGADVATLAFWLKLGYVPVHYGYKANPRSGLRSVCVIHKQSALLSVIESAAAILRSNLIASQSWDVGDAQLCQLLLAHLEQYNTPIPDHKQRALVRRFSNGQRQFMDTIGFIDKDHLATLSDYSNASVQLRKSLENSLRTLVKSSLNR